MPTLFSGHLSGEGDVHLSDAGAVPTDIDLFVSVLGISVKRDGIAPNRKLRFAGWLALWNSTYVNSSILTPERVTDPIFIQWESQDITVTLLPGNTATDMHYNLPVGTTVYVSVNS